MPPWERISIARLFETVPTGLVSLPLIRIYAFGFLVLSSIVNGATAPLPAGAWRLVDVGCSDPHNVPSADEKAFIDAMKKGESVDQYDLSDEQNGIYSQRMSFPEFGVTCLGRSPFQVSYPQDGKATLRFAYTKWTTHSNKPNTTIKCDDQGPHQESFTYRWKGKDLEMFALHGGNCGEYHWLWTHQ